MRSPIQWFGGKGRMAAKLRKYLGVEHTTYVEVFGGAGSLMFDRAAPAPVEVYNDLDGRLTNLFRVLREPGTFEAFKRAVEAIPFAKRERDVAQCLVQCPAAGDVARAAAFFVLCRQSFGGMVNKSSWGSTGGSTTGGKAQSVAAWMATIERLSEVHARLMRVQVENSDFRKIIKHYDRAETLFYLDPPYLPETRKAGTYDCELTPEDHADLLALLVNIEGLAFVSGYPSKLYDAALEGWRRDTFTVVCSACGNTRAIGNLGAGGSSDEKFRRTEVVWINPDLAERLQKIGV